MGKHRAAEAEAENSERWLLTYSDMITLLLALFVVLFAMSSISVRKKKKRNKKNMKNKTTK